MTELDNHRWALILAAGSGTRLASLTTNAAGESVPKQFCSLNGGPSLLQRTVLRARRVVPYSRVVVVVAEDHRPHWQNALPELPEANLIVQPRNKGTAIGILLPLLNIVDRDPEARVVVLPSDHYVGDETILIGAVRQALAAADDDITLLGMTPERPDAELGYIIPADRDDSGRQAVACFMEKPSLDIARRLVARGALWNSFVMTAAAHSVIDVMHERHRSVVDAVRSAMGAAVRLAAVYAALPPLDFSRDVVTPAAARVKCLRVPPCGWTDLGTPERIAECLHGMQRPAASSTTPDHAVVLDLAEAHRRRQLRARSTPEPAFAQLVGEPL